MFTEVAADTAGWLVRYLPSKLAVTVPEFLVRVNTPVAELKDAPVTYVSELASEVVNANVVPSAFTYVVVSFDTVADTIGFHPYAVSALEPCPLVAASVIPYPANVVGVPVIVLQAWLCADGANVDGLPVIPVQDALVKKEPVCEVLTTSDRSVDLANEPVWFARIKDPVSLDLTNFPVESESRLISDPLCNNFLKDGIY